MTRRELLDKGVAAGMAVLATTAVVVVGLIFAFLFKEAFPFAREPGLGGLLGTQWIPQSFQQDLYGIAPLVLGSVLVTVLALVVAIPFSVMGAVYIAEVASPREREILKPFSDLVAAMPSGVLGFFGLVVLGPWVKAAFDLNTGLVALTGALLLALMAIPTIMSISEDALRNVPRSYKEASMALGATRMQTIWRVTVPASMSGIFAGVMLGMGRVIGETMVVLMVTGNAPLLTLSPFESVRTMTATVAAEMGEVVHGGEHYQALFWLGIILLAATFLMNMAAQRVLRRYGR